MILMDWLGNLMQKKLQKKKYEVTKLQWQKVQLEQTLKELKALKAEETQTQ